MDRFSAFIDSGIKNSFYALFFLVPLVLYPLTYELFEFNKFLVTLGISLIVLFFWGSKMIIEKRIIFKRTPLDIPIALFFASQVISTILSIDPHVSFWGYYSRFNGGLLSLGAYIFLYYAFVSNFLHKETEGTEIDGPGVIHKWYVAAAFASILVFAFLVSQTQSISFFQGVFLFLTFTAPCFFFIKAFEYPSIKKLFLMVLTGGLVVALWGFSSHFGYDFTCLLFRGSLDVSCWTNAFQPMVRLFSTLGQPNWLAAYFSVLIPVSMAFGIYKFVSNKDAEQNPLTAGYYLKGEKLHGTSYILLSILLFIETLWTQSLSGYIGLLCGLLLFFATISYFSLRKQGLKKIFKNVSFRNMVVVLGIFFVCSFIFGNPLQDRIPALSFNGIVNLFHSSSPAPAKMTKSATAVPADELGGSDSGQIRLLVWKGAIKIFEQHPLFGTGVETFAYAYYGVKPRAHNLLSEWDYLYNKAHNEYLNYLATTGIFGLGSYLLMIGLFLFVTARFIIKKFDLHDLKSLLILSLVSGYITILVSNFFGFSVVIINLFMFFIPGPVIYFMGNTDKDDEKAEKLNPVKMTGIFLLGILCIYFATQLLNLWFADQSYAMGYNLDRAQQYVEANKYLEDAVNIYPGEDLYKNELSLNLATLALLLSQQKRATEAATFINRATDLSSQVITRHPYNIVFYKTRVQTLFELSEIDGKYYQQAIDALMKARALAPTDAKLAYNEGLLYGQKGDLAQAVSALNEAIYLKSNYKEPRYALAVYLSEEAKNSKDPAEKQNLLSRAKNNLNYILKYIAPGDKQTTELLKSLQ